MFEHVVKLPGFKSAIQPEQEIYVSLLVILAGTRSEHVFGTVMQLTTISQSVKGLFRSGQCFSPRGMVYGRALISKVNLSKGR